jgi:hypothetical protein
MKAMPLNTKSTTRRPEVFSGPGMNDEKMRLSKIGMAQIYCDFIVAN